MHRYAWFLVGLAAVAFGADPTPKRAADGLQRVCGWVDNPTPANWAITDKHGTWTIGVQGGSHGYGCGCLTAKADNALPQGDRR